MEPVVERILAAAKQAGLDQKDLAKMIGVRQPTITEWKKGTTSSYTKYIVQIAEVTDTTVEYLLTGDENKQPTVQDDGLSEAEQALMGLFRKLSPDQQEMVIRMVKAAADKL